MALRNIKTEQKITGKKLWLVGKTESMQREVMLWALWKVKPTLNLELFRGGIIAFQSKLGAETHFQLPKNRWRISCLWNKQAYYFLLMVKIAPLFWLSPFSNSDMNPYFFFLTYAHNFFLTVKNVGIKLFNGKMLLQKKISCNSIESAALK